jgi:glyoxylase-like metal-dependent hydrolase (beta-lactamase superfamily II)
VLLAGLAFASLPTPGRASAQAEPAAPVQADWRALFAAGDSARAAGDDEGYARNMAAAVDAMPAGLGNRPFAEYHAARANALLHRTAEAVRYLDMIWDEGIESLMISFASYDPAFDSMRYAAGYREVMNRPTTMRLTVTRLRGSVYLLEGAGSNLVASVGTDGALLVDTGYGPALPALRRALAGLGATRVSVLVLTHPHEDHDGSAAELGGEATVYAHPRTAAAMDEPYEFMEGVTLPPKPLSAHPDVTVARDTTIRFNAEGVRMVPMEAHTDADIGVYFTRSMVLDMGDAYLGGNPMMYPGTRDPDGFLDRMEAFLDELPAETIVVGGHDRPTNLDAVRMQIAETRQCMSFVRQALADGLDRDATVARAEGRFAAPWVRFFFGALTHPGV